MKNSKIVKIGSALLIATALSAAAMPRDAKAGLIVGAIIGDVSKGLTAGVGLGVGIGIAPIMFGGTFEDFWPAMSIIFGSFVLLDLETDAHNDAIQQSLKQLFPFVDDSEVLADLAARTQLKVAEQMKKTPDARFVRVSFSAREVDELFSSIGLTQQELLTLNRALN